MKGSVRRPQWPAPAAKTASQSGTARQSGLTTNSSEQARRHEDRPVDPTNRITLALLEEYSAEKSKGYDPYNASASRRPVDVWKRGPKRD
jgi:hypothetical protein